MGNWEKVFNRKPTSRCNATVVKVRLAQSVGVSETWRAAARYFPFEVISCPLSGDDCMSLLWRHWSVCRCVGWCVWVCVCVLTCNANSWLNGTSNRTQCTCCLAGPNQTELLRFQDEMINDDTGLNQFIRLHFKQNKMKTM